MAEKKTVGSFLAASAPNPSFGQVAPCWAQLELLGSQRGSYLCLTCAQRAQPRPSSSATWIQVVPLWEQLWPKSVRSTWRAQWLHAHSQRYFLRVLASIGQSSSCWVCAGINLARVEPRCADVCSKRWHWTSFPH